MSQRLILREYRDQTLLSNLTVLVRVSLLIAIACQTIDAVLLTVDFIPQRGWSSVWHAVFHTISSFNNAGFARHPDSLSQGVGDPVINIVLPLLFIFGGIGFIVLGYIHEKAALGHIDTAVQIDFGHTRPDRLGKCRLWPAGVIHTGNPLRAQHQRNAPGQLVSGTKTADPRLQHDQ